MRLTEHQIDIIRTTTAAVAGHGARAWLYGSRLDDARRGGDVDLLIQSTPPISLLQRARIKSELEQKLSIPVDVLAVPAAGVIGPFAAIAQARAQLL